MLDELPTMVPLNEIDNNDDKIPTNISDVDDNGSEMPMELDDVPMLIDDGEAMEENGQQDCTEESPSIIANKNFYLSR